MTNEYVSRYQGLSHDELYKSLQAGNPEQINKAVVGWGTIETTSRQIADAITADLKRLDTGWSSPAGREYQTRLGMVSSYSTSMANAQGTIKETLDYLGKSLAEAKTKAESPASVDDNDKAISGAKTGAKYGAPLGAPGMLVGAVVGGTLGHEQDNAEKDKARERMVQLVAAVAADYETGTYGGLPIPPPPPLPPGGGGETTPAAGPKVTAPRVMVSTGTAKNTPKTTGVGPSVESDPGIPSGTVTDSTPIPTTDPSAVSDPSSLAGTSSLLGVGGDSLIAAGAVSAVGAGALAVRQLPLGGTGLTGASLTGGMPVGGVLTTGATGIGSGSGAASATSGVAGKGNPMARPGRGASAAASESAGRTSGAGRGQGTQSGAAGRGGARGSRNGTGGQDEVEEYDSWLIEDEMVWGDGSNIAPSVLGGPTSAE